MTVLQPRLAGTPSRTVAGDGWGENTIVGATVSSARPDFAGPDFAGPDFAGPDFDGPDLDGTEADLGGEPPAGNRAARGARTRHGRAHRVPFAVLLLGVIAGGMCALLALNTATAASAVRERKLDSGNAVLSANEEELSRSVAAIQAPAELARLAAKLGLVPANSPAFLRINADGTVTVLGRPAVVPTPVVPLTPAEKAAQADAAKAKAAKAKAAQAKAAKAAAVKAKAAQAKAAQAKVAKPAKAGATPTTSGQATASGQPTTGGTSASRSTPSSTTSPKATPSTTTPSKTTPPTTSPTPSPGPTVTISGGPR